MGGVVSEALASGVLGVGRAISEPRASRLPSSSACRPVTLRHDGKVYRVSIFRLGRGERGHCHEALTKLAGRLFCAEGATHEQALAALIKVIDPELEAVRDESGAMLA
jgi:hypothetical protein